MSEIKDYSIIDNFFEEKTFKNFQTLLFSNNIPWFYRNSYIGNSKKDDYNAPHTEDDKGYFTLSFFNNDKEDYKHANVFLYEMYEKLKVKSLIETRANLITQHFKKENKLFFHIDKPFKNSHTVILYMNTNNGGTFLLEKNDETKKPIHIKSIENRLVIMKGDQLHAIDSQTDTKRRIVVNINYF
jgi:hypothetical protein